MTSAHVREVIAFIQRFHWYETLFSFQLSESSA